MKAVLGVDIGGTKIAAGLVSPSGELLSSRVIATPAADVLDHAVRLARSLLTDGVVACGVGSAGTISASGIVTHATDALPGWAGTDLLGAFSAALDLPVRVVNDVHAWAEGESRFGAAAGATSALVVTVGTGIGGAFVVDGRVLPGGALGHLWVGGDRRCPCGRVGHVEAYASGPALLAEYLRRGGQGSLEGPVADEVVREAATLLGRALGGLASTLEPAVIVIGGGVTGLGSRFLDPLSAALRAEALPGPDRVPIRLASLGSAGGVIGAASLWKGEVPCSYGEHS
ncbi:ROK family protein [Nonomuraea sediminis]|uniref:ROK family protein n=1 Tax=Nonomuraea sediminis TaxID=2835864 RepID=UPI001BDD0D5D|nr:ROK family protein [Nonomuraea sediminis]